MELRQLKYFVKTAETLNFSEAARCLYVTQSTLSQQIKSLEDELGMILFQRDSHSVSMTEGGEKLLTLAKRTLDDAESCRNQIRDLQQMLTGTLNVGVTYSFGPILSDTVKIFMKEYPGVKLNVRYKTMEELMEMLKHREVDFVLAFKPNNPYEEIESHNLFEDHLSVIMRNDHPLAANKTITLEQLERHRLAMPSKGLQARNALEKYINIEQSSLNVCLEINEVNILLDVIQHNNLVSILSEATIHNHSFLKAIPLDLPDNQMQGCVHTLKKVYRKRSADVFIKMLRDSDTVRELSRNCM